MTKLSPKLLYEKHKESVMCPKPKHTSEICFFSVLIPVYDLNRELNRVVDRQAMPRLRNSKLTPIYAHTGNSKSQTDSILAPQKSDRSRRSRMTL